MKKMEDSRLRAFFRAVIFCWLVLLPAGAIAQAVPGTDYKIDPDLLGALSSTDDATAPFFVVFGERPQLEAASRIGNLPARRRFVVQALQSIADSSQAGVRAYLRARGVNSTPFWVENKIFVPQGSLGLVRALAQRPEVVAILPEAVYAIPQPQTAGDIGTQSIAWNISKIGADQVWPLTQGSGMVVANIDTGVQYNHPALVNQYLGKTGGGFSHAGNWYDPTGVCGTTPCDNSGHGTHTMGTMVGSDGGSNQIGVAPGAKWIACKGCRDGNCLSSHLTACAQWIMDPLGNGSGSNEPNVVNNSWSGSGGNAWYQSYVRNWRAAGIFPAFSIGNNGPNCESARSPGDYPESIGVGATSINDVIANFSSRGPSKFGAIKPNLSAPGVSVRSSYPTSSYTTLSGTSMASPHIAGTVALLWSALGGYVGNISATTQLLEANAAQLITSQTCGGIPAGASPNNTYGYGRVDALAALTHAGAINSAPAVTITKPANGAAFYCPATVDFTGKASDPEDGNLNSAIVWGDNGSVFATGVLPTKSYDCTTAGNHNIVASVTDKGGLNDTDAITIVIVDPNIPTAPSNLTASVNGSAVMLRWQDNSSIETGFALQRTSRGKNVPWATIATVGANTTTYSDTPGKGRWQYRVQAFNGTQVSSPSNVVGVTVK